MGVDDRDDSVDTMIAYSLQPRTDGDDEVHRLLMSLPAILLGRNEKEL